jgi:hypothetical protein
MSIAASLTGIHIDFINGVDGSKIPQKAIPDVTSYSAPKEEHAFSNLHVELGKR